MPRLRPSRQPSSDATPAAASPGPRRWLLFVHQLPSQPSNLRVRTWRRLQQLGAIAVKQAVYVLPDSPGAREDFQWLKTEIEAAAGQASVFAADSVDAWSDDALIGEFRQSRQRAYRELAAEVERVRLGAGSRRKTTPPPAPPRVVEGFRERLAAIDRVDFFASSGRDRVVALIEQLSSHDQAPGGATGGSTTGVTTGRARHASTPATSATTMASAASARTPGEPRSQRRRVSVRWLDTTTTLGSALAADQARARICG